VHVPFTGSTYHGESAPLSETEEPRTAGPSGGPSQSARRTASGSDSAQAAASGNESSADFLRAASADHAPGEEPSSSVETSYGKLQHPPHPDGGGNQPSSISHPIRTSSPAEQPPFFDGPSRDELNKLVDSADPYPDKRPSVEEHNIANSGLRQYPANSAEGGTPGNVRKHTPGNIPADDTRLADHPEYADYKQRRQEQILSHFSSVMLYRANQERPKTNAVEVQYGYLNDGNDAKLYSSANSLKGQQWLKENSSGDKLLEHVRAAAKQDDDPDVKRHALKLLFFKENQEARKNEIDSDPKLSKEDKAKLHANLKETDELYEIFFTGTHHVVTNNPAAVQEAYGKKTQGSKKSGKTDPPVADRKVQRHAEQNIAEQMHADAPTKGLAEIAGTKIRCGSCNSVLGPSIKDHKEGYYITGQYYEGQAPKSSIHDTVAAEDERGRPAFKTSMKTGGRSSSTSPARVNSVDSDKYYQPRSDIKPPAKSAT
jgi:hypothetical protein